MQTNKKKTQGLNRPTYLPQTSDNKQNEINKRKFNIGNRFVLKSLIPIGTFYKTYKGIDLQSRKFVTIYIKPNTKEKIFSKNVKEELKQKITPPLKWSGTEKIDKNLFDIEVYARFGPSLEEVMNKYKQKISEKTFYLLAYHILKLIDKIDSAGYSIRTLNLRSIILGETYNKNDVFLMNTFDLERKNEEVFNIYDLRYCSIGSHLKLKSCSKDTLESMCYILMDFYLRGCLFDPKIEKQKDFLESKNLLKTQGIPIVFIQFYEYVKNLNHNDEIKFTEWKIKFKKCIPQDEFAKPYEWVSSSGKSKSSSTSSNQSNDNNNGKEKESGPFSFENFLKQIFDKKSYNKLAKNRKDQQLHEMDETAQQNFDFEEDQHQIDQGDLGQYTKIEQKFYESSQFKRMQY